MKQALILIIALTLTLTLSASDHPTRDEISETAPTQESTELNLRFGRFDPLIETISTPLDNRQLLKSASAPARHGIVQFRQNRELDPQLIDTLGATVLAYIPDNAYLVEWDQTSREALNASGQFRYIGDYEPRFRISPALWPEHLGNHPRTRIRVEGFSNRQPGLACKTLIKAIPDLRVIYNSVTERSEQCVASVRSTDMDKVYALAESDHIMWIDKALKNKTMNSDSVGPIQSGTDSIMGATLWDQDLLGTGQIVSVVDSGLDRNEAFFTRWTDANGDAPLLVTDAEQPPLGQVGNLFPDNKVVAYYIQPGASEYDDNTVCDGSPGSFHGTHVTGSVAGDKPPVATSTEPNHDDGDGMAPHAQLLFQDIGSTQTGCLDGQTGYEMFSQAFKAGAAISSNSYGGSAPSAQQDGYSFSDREVDRITYDVEQLLVVVAAGNSGGNPVDLIIHPAQAKNSLAVAALGHGNSTAAAVFTSTGPAADGRIKPDISAPGTSIRSAAGNAENSNPPPGIAQPSVSLKSGTSMATPTVSGGAAMMRQYFMDGFYPDGVRVEDNRLTPSGALMKATLLNGTLTTGILPDLRRGWGRIWLDNNLYFAGDDRHLRVFDVANDLGLKTGESNNYQIEVNAGEEFRATLVWYDPPANSVNGTALVNDLDLIVTTPDGTYLGNVFSAGNSVTGGSRDILNPVEQVILAAPVSGTYTVEVAATSVPGNGPSSTTRQGYALAVSATQCDSAVSAAPELELVNGEAGPTINLSAVANADSYQIYRTDGNCSADASLQRLVGTTSNGSLIDRLTQGGNEYAYRARAVDACGEGPISGCKSVVSQAACSLPPQFDAASVTLENLDTADCGVTLNWQAGQTSCAGTSLSYNIYRSTDPEFLPSAGNLVAQGLTSTSYTDTAVESFVTYYYAVRAEDTSGFGPGPNGGNESDQISRFSITTQSGIPASGNFVENADDIVFSSLEEPWRVTQVVSASGPSSFSIAEDGLPYVDQTCAFLTTPPIELQTSGTPGLSYDARYDMEPNWDGVVVQISNDGGQSWNDLPPAGGYPSDLSMTQQNGGEPVNECGFPATQGAFNGTINSFQSFTSDLSAFAGDTIQIRWAFTSDPNTNGDGFFLDNIVVTDASTPAECVVNTGASAGISGSWYNASQSGHGWLLEVLDPIPGTTSDRLNAYWYVYLNGEQVWMTGAGSFQGNQATVDAFITDGPNFPPAYDSADLNLTPWGQMTFTFADDENATVSWNSDVPGFGNSSMDITQLIGISDSANSCRSGTWFSSAQNGHGYVMEVVNIGGSDQVILAWYVYLNGQQVWLFGLGPLEGDTAVVPVEIFNGPQFPPNYDENSLVRQNWGTVTVDFTGPDTATMSWNPLLPEYTQGTLDVNRLTTLKGHQCN